MVNQTFSQKKSKLYFALKWLWFLLTAAALLLVLFTTWIYNKNKHLEHLNLNAKEIRLNLDDLIDDVFRSIMMLPIHKEEVQTCSKQLFTQMQKLTFNNPEVSGLYLADKNHHILCSTIDNSDNNILQDIQLESGIHGPFSNQGFEHPYFLIQQPIGHYYAGAFVLSDVFKKYMKSASNHVGSIVLYDFIKQKQLIKLNPSSDINRNKIQLEPLDLSKHPHYLSNKLQSIDNAMVVMQSNQENILKQVLETELLFTLIIILMSILLYHQLHQIMSRRFSLKGLLQYALKHHQYFPMYQPIYDASQSEYVGAEILLRWRTGNGEVIMPEAFIDEAESTGLIVPITTVLINQAFEECHNYLKTNQNFHIAFNLSKHHFSDAQFLWSLIDTTQRYHINPQQILLELTERHLLDLFDDDVSKKIAILREKGFSLAIDDYGTGHASINYLQNLPFNYIKIDKIYIHSIGSGAITETLIDTIIEMANKLKLTIIAEGVETESQLNYLLARQVHLHQGWLFAKAMDFNELVTWINKD